MPTCVQGLPWTPWVRWDGVCLSGLTTQARKSSRFSEIQSLRSHQNNESFCLRASRAYLGPRGYAGDGVCLSGLTTRKSSRFSEIQSLRSHQNNESFAYVRPGPTLDPVGTLGRCGSVLDHIESFYGLIQIKPEANLESCPKKPLQESLSLLKDRARGMLKEPKHCSETVVV